MIKLTKIFGEAFTAVRNIPLRPEPTHPSHTDIAYAQFMQLEEIAADTDFPALELERMHGLKVSVEVVLVPPKMPLEEILKLRQGDIAESKHLAKGPVGLVTNDKIIAKAEIAVIEDKFGIKILEIVGTKQKLNAGS